MTTVETGPRALLEEWSRRSFQVMTTSALLSALPFSMDATDAPEPRDVIWPNVFVSARSVARRHVVVTILLTVLVLSWTTVITFCSNAVWIVDLLGFDPQGFVASAAVSILPSALLLTIMCVLPPIFEAVAKFYERRKSYTEVDLSVARRYFTFQFVNVYVSILSTASSRFRTASAVASSFSQPLHLQSGWQRLPAAKQTQYLPC